MSYPYDKSGQNGPEDQPQVGFAPLEYPPQPGPPPAAVPPAGYPQQPYPAQSATSAPGFGPQPGYPMPAYPAAGYAPYAPQAPVSGGTAITAGVLGVISGVLSLVAGVIMVIAGFVISGDSSRNGRYSDDSALFGVLLGVGFVVLLVGIAWCVGATLLFMRKRAGQIMLIVMSSIAVVLGVLSMGLNRAGSGVIGLLFSIAILVFAAVPPTGRWIAAGKLTPAPQQPYYPYY